MTVDVLAASAGAPSALAMASGARSWSYAQLGSTVDERAAGLAGQGVRAGSIVPVVVAAEPADVVELLALWRLGAVPAPLNSRLTTAERGAAVAALTGHEPRVPDGTQAVLWTSGTGGRPRGVALSWDNLSASAHAAAERLELGSSDVWWASLSPAHVGGLALVTRSLALGGALVVDGEFDAARCLDLLGGGGASATAGPVTHMSLVPTQLVGVLDAAEGGPPATFRCALIGGAHAPAELVERALAAGWPIALTYGATETTSQAATAPPSLTRRKAGTVGGPLPGVEIDVAEDDEILVRGPTTALGYLAGGTVEPVVDDDGWYHTGDLGRIDEEGHLRVTGRRIDRIVSGGVTVDAVEVEEAVRSLPAVIDACVVGLPDAEWGERVGVWLDGVEGELDIDDVADRLRDRLTGAKLPRVWYLGGALPRNANGKVDRVRVLEVLRSREG